MDNVSVIIRNKNEERWIGHAIQSVVDFIDSPEIIIVEPSAYHSLFVVTEIGSTAAYAALDIPHDNSERDSAAKKNFPQSFMLTELTRFLEYLCIN